MALSDMAYLIALGLCVPLQIYLTQNTAPDTTQLNSGWMTGGHGMFQTAFDVYSKARDGGGSLAWMTTMTSPVAVIRRLQRIRTGKANNPAGDSDGDSRAGTPSGGGGRAPVPGRSGPSTGPRADQSPATEVVKSNYFGGARKARTDRTGVKYRLGQVFVHKKHGYKGVVVGWDKVAKAPTEWFDMNNVPMADRTNQPWYSVIVDVRDRDQSHSRTYVTESNMELTTDTEVAMDFKHPDRKILFKGFNTRMRIWQPRPALKKRYPFD